MSSDTLSCSGPESKPESTLTSNCDTSGVTPAAPTMPLTAKDTDVTNAAMRIIGPTTILKIKAIHGHTEDGIHCAGCKYRFDECDVDDINHHICCDRLPPGSRWEIERPPKPETYFEEPPKKRRRGLKKKKMFYNWVHCKNCGMDLECECGLVDKSMYCPDCFFRCKSCKGYFETPHHMIDNSKKLCRDCYELFIEPPTTKCANCASNCQE